MPPGQPQGVLELVEQAGRDVVNVGEPRSVHVVNALKGLIVVEDRELGNQRGKQRERR